MLVLAHHASELFWHSVAHNIQLHVLTDHSSSASKETQLLCDIDARAASLERGKISRHEPNWVMSDL